MTDIEIARRLRRDMTEAEKIMWRLLRSRQLEGVQVPTARTDQRYVVDFVCFKPRLIVEIDGGQHNDDSAYEERRTAFFRGERFEILRCWNNEVLENHEGVCERILEVLRALPLTLPALRAGPLPLPRGERGKIAITPPIS